MIMKRQILLSIFLTFCTWAFAQFTTAGDGTTYSIQGLSYVANAEVVPCEMEEGQTPVYMLRKSITIAGGDRFVMDDGIVVQFDKDVTLTIEGDADFALSQGSTFDSAYDGGSTLGSALCIKSATATTFENCHFYYVGLEMMGEGGVTVRQCSFHNHDGSAAAALYFVSAGDESVVEDCHFEMCRKAAIGSAANASQPLTIQGCSFVKNSAANGNVPQINITAASPLCIKDCTITGNPDNTMVGGIGISNFMSYDADVTISGCTITDNRYGIGLVGPAAKIRIENCVLKGNHYEQNPMNGGSGISLYDPYQQTCAVITGNHIEGSLWGITVIGCQDVNIGRTDVPQDDERYNVGGNTFRDNGNGGVLYDLYNNSANTVYAQNNTWNVSEQTEEQIETVIFHRHDDASLGEVIFWPAAAAMGLADEGLRMTDNNSASGSSDCYTLQGVPIKNPQKGIFIQHGKKIVKNN